MWGRAATTRPQSAKRKRRGEGVVVRHGRRGATRSGGACSCTPSFQAQVWSGRDRKTLHKTFATIGEARVWRQESQVALRKGTLRAPSATTLREVAEGW